MRAPDQLNRPARGPWAHVVRASAFVRKELVEIVRQPRLLALLVIGPFGLLLLFGAGYSQQQMSLRTTFVGPDESIYEEMLEQYADEVGRFVDSQGYTTDEAGARADLRDGDVDLVVIFPDDPLDRVMAGERAEIVVLHDEIDPIRSTAIEVAAQMAIQEVNATVLSTVAAETQDRLAPAAELAGGVATTLRAVEASGALTEADRAAIDEDLGALALVLDGSATVLGRLAPDDPEVLARLDEARSSARDLRTATAAEDADLAAMADQAELLSQQVDDVVALDPDVLVRPFQSDTETVRGRTIDPTHYFTPSSLALLLQHLALTFAALSLVRDQRTGLFELLRIGPMSSLEILVGKCLAFLVVGGSVAAALTWGAVELLDLPFAGSVAWFAVMAAGVILSSLAFGMVLSSWSATESQAVQFAMLTLLAGLFFSGFVLSIDDLSYPVKYLSWLLPVTYGIRSFQSIMLRGEPPATEDVIGVAALTLGYGAIAVAALHRRLRDA